MPKSPTTAKTRKTTKTPGRKPTPGLPHVIQVPTATIDVGRELRDLCTRWQALEANAKSSRLRLRDDEARGLATDLLRWYELYAPVTWPTSTAKGRFAAAFAAACECVMVPHVRGSGKPQEAPALRVLTGASRVVGFVLAGHAEGMGLDGTRIEDLYELSRQKARGDAFSEADQAAYADGIRVLRRLQRRLVGGNMFRAHSDVPPLTDTQRAVWRMLCELPPGDGLNGRELCKKLDELGKGLGVDQSTLTKRIIPPLKKLGVENKRGVGYFCPASKRRTL